MKLNIDGKNVLLVGNRGHKNMGDEIILLGNMKNLLQQGKKIYVACSNKDWLIGFHKQFFEDSFDTNKDGFFDKKSKEQVITYLYEFPKGFRSLFRFVKNIRQLKKYFEVNSILIGGGEILTEETPYSYWYWLMSVWLLLPFKKLYLSGGIQIPKRWWNKFYFWILTKKAEKIYTRDYDLVNNKKIGEKVEFFPDTSIFVYDDIDLGKYKWNIEKECSVGRKYIVINVNKKAEKFYEQVENIVSKYYNNDYDVYFAHICKSPADDDIVYYHKLKQKYHGLKLLDWENWNNFIDILLCSDRVYTTRLHLFLLAFYLDLKVEPFVYEKKVEKMKKVLGVV